jgi:hypothetical protein
MDIHSAVHIPSTSGPAGKPEGKTRGRIQARHSRVAALIARGFPISFVAKEAGLSETRIYHLLADPDSFVNQEVHRILNDLFGDLAGTWGTWGQSSGELGVSPGNHEAFSNRFLKDTNVRSLCVSTLRDACVTLDTSPICNF